MPFIYIKKKKKKKKKNTEYDYIFLIMWFHAAWAETHLLHAKSQWNMHCVCQKNPDSLIQLSLVQGMRRFDL